MDAENVQMVAQHWHRTVCRRHSANEGFELVLLLLDDGCATRKGVGIITQRSQVRLPGDSVAA